ncbi:MAG: hypothetical protein ACR2GH_06335 [Pseudonocardia sp.]
MDSPEGPHWWASRDPEPGPEVLAVALLGRDPGFLRSVRVLGGWHTRGAAATYADLALPEPWAQVGCCWDGVEHPVLDVTAASMISR